MWALFESVHLTVNTSLTGLFEDSSKLSDVDSVLDEIQAAKEEEQHEKCVF